MFPAIAMVVIAIVSMVYSVVQQRKAARKAAKAQKEAEKAEDRRKGIEVVTEGESRPLAVVYGRAKVGGARVFHAVQNSFHFNESNADHTFGTGLNAGTTTTVQRSTETQTDGTVTYNVEQVSTQVSTGVSLGSGRGGYKNEYLFWQQVLCYGPIHQVIDVIIEDSNTLDNPVYGSLGISHKMKKKKGKVKYWYNGGPGNALRIDLHFGSPEGVADAVCVANNASRSTAKFPGMAYASCVCKQDRDDPAFSAVPKLQFLIEGLQIKKLQKASNGVITLKDSLEYTTNPAAILIDYLTNNIYGAGLDFDEYIDAESFYKAQVLADEIVLRDAAVGGLFWQNSDRSRTIEYRDIPRFECCMAIDGSQPIRENVNQILKTLPGAKLIWSQGKFKLVLNYPKNISELSALSVKEIDDTDIVASENLDITGTTGDNRYNWCKVTYADEAQMFENNSVSWPPKKTEQYKEPIGGTVWPMVTGWDSSAAGGQFLNSYAVARNDEGYGDWETITYDFIAEKTGEHTIQANGDDGFKLTLKHVTKNNGIRTEEDTYTRGGVNYSVTNANIGATYYTKHRKGIVTKKITLVANEQYRIYLQMRFTDTGAKWYDSPPLYGAGFCVTDSNGVQLCSSRDAAYTDYINKSVTDTIYRAYLTQDSNMELETEITADGITDYYHALALAEQTVRQSRSSAIITLKVVLKDSYYEPGDIVTINSDYLNLGTGKDINGNPIGFTYYKCKITGKSTIDPPNNATMWIQTGAVDLDTYNTFTTGTSYSVGDVVKYNNTYYECKKACIASTTPDNDTTNWKQRTSNPTYANYVSGSTYNKGDIVYYSNGTVTKPYFEVDTAQYEENDTCTLTLKRFDPNMLAWNVDDDQLAPVTQMFSQEHIAPAWVRFKQGVSIYQGSAGIIEWATIPGNNILNYSIFVNIGGERDLSGSFKWTLLGQANEPPFSLGALDISRAIFGVCANYKDNVQSDITMAAASFALDDNGNKTLAVFAWEPCTTLDPRTGERIRANYYHLAYKDYKNNAAYTMAKRASEMWVNGESTPRLYFRCKETIGYKPTPDKDTAHWRVPPTWANNVAYSVNANVTYNNKIYKCTKAVSKPASGKTNAAPDSTTGKNSWQERTNIPAWSVTNTFNNLDLVTYSSKVYECTNPGSQYKNSPVTDTLNWQLTTAYMSSNPNIYISNDANASIGYANAEWNPNTTYVSGDLVTFENNDYICIETQGYKSTTNPINDTAYWELLDDRVLDATAWKSGTTYRAGDLVYYQLTNVEKWTGNQGAQGNYYWGGGTATSAWTYSGKHWQRDTYYIATWKKGVLYKANSIVCIGGDTSNFYVNPNEIAASANTKQPNQATNLWTKLPANYKMFAVIYEFWRYWVCKTATSANSSGNPLPQDDPTHWTEILDFWAAGADYTNGQNVLYNDDGVIRAYHCKANVSDGDIPPDDKTHWTVIENNFNNKNAYAKNSTCRKAYNIVPKYYPVEVSDTLYIDEAGVDMAWAASAKIEYPEGVLFKLNGATATPAQLTFKAKLEYFINPKYEWYFIGRESTILSNTDTCTVKYNDVKGWFGSAQRLHLKVCEKVNGNNVRHDDIGVFALSSTKSFYAVATRPTIDVYCDEYGNPKDASVQWDTDIYVYKGTQQVYNNLYFVTRQQKCKCQILEQAGTHSYRMTIHDVEGLTGIVMVTVEERKYNSEEEDGDDFTVLNSYNLEIVINMLREAYPARTHDFFEVYTELAYTDDLNVDNIWTTNLGTNFKPVKGDRLLIHTSTTLDENGVAIPTDGAREVAFVYNGIKWIEQKYYFDGNMLVKGTVTADAVTADSVESLRGIFDDVVAGQIIGESCIFRGKLEAATGEFAGTVRAGVIDFSACAGKTLSYSGNNNLKIQLNQIPDFCTEFRVDVIGAGGGGWSGVVTGNRKAYQDRGCGGGSGGAVTGAALKIKKIRVATITDYDIPKEIHYYQCTAEIIGGSDSPPSQDTDHWQEIGKGTSTEWSSEKAYSVGAKVYYNTAASVSPSKERTRADLTSAMRAPSTVKALWHSFFSKVELTNGTYLVLKSKAFSSEYVVARYNGSTWTFVCDATSYSSANCFITVKTAAGGKGYDVKSSTYAYTHSGAYQVDSELLIPMEDNARIIARSGSNATGPFSNILPLLSRESSKHWWINPDNEIHSISYDKYGNPSYTKDSKGKIFSDYTKDVYESHPSSPGKANTNKNVVSPASAWKINGDNVMGKNGQAKGATYTNRTGNHHQSYWLPIWGRNGGANYTGTVAKGAKTGYESKYEHAYDGPKIDASAKILNYAQKGTYGGGGGGGGVYWEYSGHDVAFESPADGGSGSITIQMFDGNSVVLRQEYEDLVLRINSMGPYVSSDYFESTIKSLQNYLHDEYERDYLVKDWERP